MFNLDQLLLPVSAVHPCGEDISFSQELDAVARARQHDDPSLDQGEWVVALKEADWPFVATRCEQLIASHSKDLRVAVWLAEAHARTRHFRGLGDGYALLAGLCEQYWDGLFPLAEEGDQEQRIGNLFWLLTRTPQLVREIPLTDGAQGSEGQFSLQDFDVARQRATSQAQAVSEGWGEARHDEGVTLAQMETARQRNTRAYTDGLLADARYCMQSLLALERCVDARLGTDGPSFRAAREALENAIHFISPLLPGTELPGAVPGAAPAIDNGSAIVQRHQALAQLRQVADFFRRTEPHSPVAYLADKAASWGEMPLHVWLRAVVKDQGTLAQLDEMLGTASGQD
ncbi:MULTISPECIES: type VI secretion system protein TssA [unclassified Janthinobacterium]|uniref:type VI secretion system protein TssA n=1 Tax=unclassified Janthinobacterium TaxID=2610881 RepID=UPI00160D49D9|nr:MULTISPECIES: type VI secretion system protein TssA [unclassified Janthinobacterium]MBB5367093.1 type VI secretion system protein ImpA [Janthinobacterium sp. K2C7]MBB5380429.1 type VI secretion system protein ImpA [Janthinobacterium sp. K2Li3]MBB5385475.1 type VI secretion system protein ImpA [Janthinobacterium sp. K2E3]